jgi:hypothetical protein
MTTGLSRAAHIGVEHLSLADPSQVSRLAFQGASRPALNQNTFWLAAREEQWMDLLYDVAESKLHIEIK